MSDPRYSILPALAVFDQRLNCTELRVLAALGTYTDRQGWCYPSQKDLTTKLGIARSTLGAAIKKLASEEIGYLEIAPRTTPGRGKVGNLYRVRMDLPANEMPMSAQPDNGKKPMSSQSDNGPQRSSKKPMSEMPDNGADVRLAGQPMSAQPDIAYKEGTTPIERPVVSNETTKGGKGFELIAAEAEPSKPKQPKKRKPQVYDPAFNEVWLSWPQSRRERSDKQTAFRRWQGGVEQFGADAIARAASRYLSLPDTRKDGYRYCCLVEVFMNGKLEAMVEAVTGATDETGASTISAETWAEGLAMWRNGRKWISDLGPKPDQKGYRGPPLEQAV